MTELYQLSIKEKLQGLKNSFFSSSELTQSYLDRIKQIDPKINSYITVLEEEALQQAIKSEKRKQHTQLLHRSAFYIIIKEKKYKPKQRV